MQPLPEAANERRTSFWKQSLQENIWT